jgi:hypothetical protein
MRARRNHRSFDLLTPAMHGIRIAAIAGVLAGTAIAGWPSAVIASGVGVEAQVALSPAALPKNDPGDRNPPPRGLKCEPHHGKGSNPHCPPPVIPEAPMAVLLPLGAGGLFAAAYLVARRRNGVELAI